MKKLTIILLFLAFCFVSVSALKAQALDKIDWKKPIKLSGSLGGGMMLYTTNNEKARRDPFFWTLSGNLSIDILGFVQVPLSLNISQQSNQFAAQPFNQFGLSPSYKWITVHGGYRTMDFSPFTLSGQVFLGGGVDLNPENSPVRVSAMYGRFAKAISQGGQVGILSGEPTYERWGYGAKLSLGRDMKKAVDLIFFKAKDDIASIERQAAVTPAENTVIGLVTKQALSKKILIDLDYAYSVYTSDIGLQTEGENANLDKMAQAFAGIMNVNLSTQSSFALKTGVSYNLTKYQFRLGYQRINPNYRSMGTAFLNNDLEDITLNVSWKMLKDKMSITAGGGFQRNNLDNNLATDLTKLSYNFNATYAPTDKLNFSASYSNFNSSTKILASSQNVTNPTLRLDSLRLLQLTNSASLGATYQFGTKDQSHNLNANLNYQGANDQANNANTLYTASAGYGFQAKKKDFNLNLAVNYNQNKSAASDNVTMGPTLSMMKGFLKKKLKLNYAGMIGLASVNGASTGTNMTHRIGAKYQLGKHHSFSADVNYLLRNSNLQPSFYEMRTGANYMYTF